MKKNRDQIVILRNKKLTMCLTDGVDIYTVSKLLGTEVRTRSVRK